MAKKSHKKADNPALDAWKSSRIAVFAQVSFVTVAMMLLLAGGGYLLDQWLGSFPTLFIIGLVLAFPLAQVVIWRQVKRFASSKLKK